MPVFNIQFTFAAVWVVDLQVPEEGPAGVADAACHVRLTLAQLAQVLQRVAAGERGRHAGRVTVTA